MKLSDFKKDLKAVGIKYGRLKELIRELEYAVHCSDTSYEAIEERLFSWTWSKEGYAYWNKKHKALCKLCLVAKEGEVLDHYSIEKAGKNWVIGCQTITPKQKLKLFKLLADDLGYELTED